MHEFRVRTSPGYGDLRIRCLSKPLGDRNLKRHFSPALASAPSSEPPLGDPGGTRSWRWGRRLASSLPRAAAMWAGDLASAGERRAAGHEEAAGRKALGTAPNAL